VRFPPERIHLCQEHPNLPSACRGFESRLRYQLFTKALNSRFLCPSSNFRQVFVRTCQEDEEATIRMTKLATIALVCLVALSAAGCAVEVPMSSFRLAPPDETSVSDKAQHQDLKHVRTR